MLTFSTENTLSLEPKSPLGTFACSTTRLLYCSPVSCLLWPALLSTFYLLLLRWRRMRAQNNTFYAKQSQFPEGC